MKIVTYNIQFGFGKDERFDLERVAGEVEGADVIALQEVERYWQRSGNVEQPAQLARILHKYYWANGPYFDVDASKADPDGWSSWSNFIRGEIHRYVGRGGAC